MFKVLNVSQRGFRMEKVIEEEGTIFEWGIAAEELQMLGLQVLLEEAEEGYAF
jgi:hypothetical protein